MVAISVICTSTSDIISGPILKMRPPVPYRLLSAEVCINPEVMEVYGPLRDGPCQDNLYTWWCQFRGDGCRFRKLSLTGETLSIIILEVLQDHERVCHRNPDN